MKKNEGSPFNIAIENCVCLNTGDAAIMQAIIKIVDTASGRENNYRIFDSAPSSVRRLYETSNGGRLTFHRLLSEIGVSKIHATDGVARRVAKPVLSRLSMARIWAARKGFGTFSRDDNEAVRSYSDADMVITTGGTYLTENYNINHRLKQFEIGRMFGKDTIFFTQSLGPFAKPSNRTRLRKILGNVPLLLLRDERSHRHLDGIISDGANCHVVADSVFALADVPALQQKLKSPFLPSINRRVAVSVREWAYVAGGDHGMSRYADSVRAMVQTLVREYGYGVTFLSTCQGVPEYHHDDALLAERIWKSLDEDVQTRVDVDAAFHTPDALMKTLRTFDFVISTRMHMMIMALNVGTPVLPIVYEFKTEELSKKVGLSDVILNIDTIEPAQATTTLRHFLENFQDFARRSIEGALSENGEAMRCVDLIRPFFSEPGARQS